MTIVLNGYLIACAVAFALCWLGMMACILVVIVEAIRGAGSLGPSFALLFVAQSRSGQLPGRSQRAMLLAKRFRRWAFRAWCAAVAGVAVIFIYVFTSEAIHPATASPPPNNALRGR